jgi:hypothetical protein
MVSGPGFPQIRHVWRSSNDSFFSDFGSGFPICNLLSSTGSAMGMPKLACERKTESPGLKRPYKERGA